MQCCSNHLNSLLSSIIPTLLKQNARTVLDNARVSGVNCNVLYGNDQVFLDAFIDAYVCKIAGGDTQVKKKNNDICTYSDHHFEFDLSFENFMDQIKYIRDIQKNKTIIDDVRVVYIKNLTKSRGKLLHHFIDNATFNLVIFISSPKLQDIDANIMSRASLVNMAFDKDAMYGYCNNNIREVSRAEFDTLYALSLGNMINLVLRLECNNDIQFEKALVELLDAMLGSRSFLVCVTKIREFVYKAYHLNVPFAYMSRLILNKYKDSPKIRKIAALCASCDHKNKTVYKDIFVYEYFFLELRDVIKEKEMKKSFKDVGK